MKLPTLLLVLLLSVCNGQDAGTGYNNSCLYEKDGLNREGPTELDCPRFVIESTDLIWNMYRGIKQYVISDY